MVVWTLGRGRSHQLEIAWQRQRVQCSRACRTENEQATHAQQRRVSERDGAYQRRLWRERLDAERQREAGELKTRWRVDQRRCGQGLKAEVE